MIKIRKLRASDFKNLSKNELAYEKELKKDARFGIGTYGRKLTGKLLKEQFNKRLKNQKSGGWIVLVAEHGNELIGEATAQGEHWPEAPHIAELGLSVMKEHRRKGTGTALMKELIKKCGKKYEIVTATAFSSNFGSKRLLKKLGFKKWAHGPGFVKRGKMYMDSEMYYLRLK